MDLYGERVSLSYFFTNVGGYYPILLFAAKHVPVAYGIKKLQISCVVEDDKIGTDFLEESITAFEDHVRK